MKDNRSENHETSNAFSLQYPDSPLPVFLLDTVARHPGYIATTFNDSDITYRELNEKVNGFAHALRALGIKKGDRVALILPNAPTYVIAAYGAMKMGAVIVNINAMTQGKELIQSLNDSGSRVVVTLDLFVQNVFAVAAKIPLEKIIIHSVFGLEKKMDPEAGVPAPLIFNDLVSAQPKEEPELRCAGEDIAVLQYTSGATGNPKAAVLTHKNIVSNVTQINGAMPVGDLGNEAVICIVPFFHVFGMTVCLHLSVFKGYRMILIPIFDWSSILSLMEMIEKYRPHSFPAVAPLWAALVSHPEAAQFPLSSIEIPSGGGAPMPPWVQENYEKLTGRKIMEAYGLSEASSTTHINPIEHVVPGSIGVPIPDTEAKIVDIETGENECPQGDVGELIVKGPQIMEGYWNDPGLTAKALRGEWLYTGDLARVDHEGYFYIVDRRDDLIISSGYNIYPSDVEAVLMKHPEVKDVAVIGAPDAVRGQSIKAFVVLKEEGGAGKKELLAFCRERLPAYKVPKSIVFRDDIPRNPAGKPLRRVLREEIKGSAVPQ
ncbi:MAG: long-chain fatty acid--CoA ligase [Deltaproteobacteria bacterium]|nr:long-chain fatty acid--CoA ligase [Deltaproteobacteria bacterium]